MALRRFLSRGVPPCGADGVVLSSVPRLVLSRSPNEWFEFMAPRKFWPMKPTLCFRQRARITVVIGVTVALAATGVATAYANGWFSGPAHDFSVVADSFSGHGTVSGNVLRNHRRATAVVRSTQPGNGKVTVNADGTFTYTPNSGFTGADMFTAGLPRRRRAGRAPRHSRAELAQRSGAAAWPRCPVPRRRTR